MFRYCALVLLTVVVVGCAGPEKVQAPGQVQTSEQRQKREQRQKHIAAENKRVAEHLQRDLGPICTSAGLTSGTDAHSRCVDSLYRLELERRATSAGK